MSSTVNLLEGPLQKKPFAGSIESSSFNRLPKELIVQIFSSLGIPDLRNVALSCKHFYNLSSMAAWVRVELMYKPLKKLIFADMYDFYKICKDYLALLPIVFKPTGNRPGPYCPHPFSLLRKCENLEELDLSLGGADGQFSLDEFLEKADNPYYLPLKAYLLSKKISDQRVDMFVKKTFDLLKNGKAEIEPLPNVTSLTLNYREDLNSQHVAIFGKLFPHLKKMSFAVAACDFNGWSKATSDKREVFQALSQLGSECPIEELSLCGYKDILKDDPAFKCLSLPHLKAVNFSDSTALTEGTLIAFIKKHPKLELLKLNFCYYGVTDQSIATMTQLENLKALSIVTCFKITSVGMNHLKNMKETREDVHIYADFCLPLNHQAGF